MQRLSQLVSFYNLIQVAFYVSHLTHTTTHHIRFIHFHITIIE